LNFENVLYSLSAFFAFYIFAFIPINMLNLGILGLFITGVLPAMAVGYIFANKMVQSRTVSIAKILVLATVLVALFLPTFTGYIDWYNFQASNPSSTLQASEFMVFMGRQTFMFIAYNLAILLPAAFIGLFVGSLLRKPAK
jgi:hypothetical protein